MDIQEILEQAFVTSRHPIGRSYIAPNGLFISTMPYEDDTFGEPNHATILDYLYDNGYIESPSYSELEERGYVRVSNWDSTIVLPRIKPTEAQYRAIREWIDSEYEEENMRDILIDAPTEFKRYNLYDGDVDSKYVVDRIRRYYTTNVLYEDLEHPFPNSKVKQVVYHTSNKDFDKFDSRKKGSNTGWVDTNLGYFFSDNKEITKQFGNITKAYYIDVRKPLDLRVWRRIRADSFEELNPDEQQVVIDLIKSQGVEPTEEYIQSIIDGASDFDAQSEIREQLADKESMRNLRRLGYDSIIDTMDSSIGANEYIVFNSNQIKVKERLEESLNSNKLNLSEYNVKEVLRNNPDSYRILYDDRLEKYMIGNAYDIVHRDLIIDALENGYYENQRDFIETFGAIDNYIEVGLDGYYDKELVDEDIDPFLYPLVFIPKGKEEDIEIETNDGYVELFEYDFGYILSRENDFRETSLYKILGEPVSTKYL